MAKIPYLKIQFKNQVDLVDKLLQIYDISKKEYIDPKTNKPRALRNFERQVLNYYIRYGYSKDTKSLIIKDTDKKANALIQIDYLLKEAGYLEDSDGNFRMKKLNPYLETMREKFILTSNRVYGVHFSNE